MKGVQHPVRPVCPLPILVRIPTCWALSDAVCKKKPMMMMLMMFRLWSGVGFSFCFMLRKVPTEKKAKDRVQKKINWSSTSKPNLCAYKKSLTSRSLLVCAVGTFLSIKQKEQPTPLHHRNIISIIIIGFFLHTASLSAQHIGMRTRMGNGQTGLTGCWTPFITHTHTHARYTFRNTFVQAWEDLLFLSPGFLCYAATTNTGMPGWLICC